MLGDRLRKLRTDKHLTQQALAHGICTRSMLSHIENGDAQPSLDLLTKLCERLGVRPAHLLNEEQQHAESGSLIEQLDDLIMYGDYDEALEYARGVLRLQQVQANLEIKCEVLRLMGVVHNRSANFEEGLRIHREAVKLSETCNVELRMECMNGLAAALASLGQLDEALNILLETYELSTTIQAPNKNQIYLVYNIAKLTRALHMDDRALHWIRQGLHLSRKTGIYECADHLEVLMGVIQLQQGKLTLAEECFHRALKLYEYTDNARGQIGCLVNLAEVYISKRDYSNALKSLKRAETAMLSGDADGLRPMIDRAYEQLRLAKRVAKVTGSADELVKKS